MVQHTVYRVLVFVFLPKNAFDLQIVSINNFFDDFQPEMNYGLSSGGCARKKTDT